MSLDLLSIEYLTIVIIPRSTLTRKNSTNSCLIEESKMCLLFELKGIHDEKRGHKSPKNQYRQFK